MIIHTPMVAPVVMELHYKAASARHATAAMARNGEKAVPVAVAAVVVIAAVVAAAKKETIDTNAALQL